MNSPSPLPPTRRAVLLSAACISLAGCSGRGVLKPAPLPTASRQPTSGLGAFEKTGLDAELRALIDDPAAAWAQLSTLAIRDGQVVYSGHFGRRRIHPQDSSQDLPVDDRTLFRIASVSKLVVSVGVMRLVDQGKLDLDADVSEVLGWSLRHPSHPAQPISLRLLMTHRSGLSDAGGYAWGTEVALRDVLVPGGRLFRDGASWRPDRAPGSWFNYVNLNWGVVGTVMERATGERFDRLMAAEVLRPLGLRGGFLPAELPEADLADIATLYRKRRIEDAREIWDPQGPWVAQADDYRAQRPRAPQGLERYEPGTNATLFGPQGSLRISTTDLGTLMQVLMNNGFHQGRRFLSAGAMSQLLSEQWRFSPARPNGDTLDDGMLAWALGPQRFTDTSGPGRGDRLVEGGGLSGWGHMGDAYGLLSCFVLDPQRRHGFVTVLAGPSRSPYSRKGRWSSMARDEERVNTALWRGALLSSGGLA